MRQKELVLRSVKNLLSIYDRRLEALRQAPIPLDMRLKKTRRISQTIVAGVKQIKKAIQQEEETHNG